MSHELEQAQKCLQIARAKEDTDIDQAIRMVEKSLRIHPTEEGRVLLAQLQNKKLLSEKNEQFEKQEHQEQPKHHRASTIDPRTLAVQTLRLKDYYDILGVTRSADDAQIKRAFRLRAVKLHPDKNKAPEAGEAFKKLNAAYQCLSDPAKRRTYDRYGNEEGHTQMRSPFGEREDLSAEDVMNMFFTPNGARRRYREANGHGHEAPQGAFQLLGLLPFLFLIVFSLLSALPQSSRQASNLFRLQPGQGFSNHRRTSSGLDYWVPHDFNRFYGRDYRALGIIEAQVESQVKTDLDTACKKERKEQQQLFAKARQAQDKPEKQAELLQKAADFHFPSCDRLEQIFLGT
eukprot:g19727.t1